jgi:hypothetical protein
MAVDLKCAFCEKEGDDLEGIEFASGTPSELSARRNPPPRICWDCLSSLMLCAAVTRRAWFDEVVDAANQNPDV